MVTSLIAGAVVPIWDRALVHALQDAVLGAPEEPTTSHMVVVNDSGDPYRRIVVNGPIEYRKLRDCLSHTGFGITLEQGEATVVRQSETASSPRTL